MIVPALLIIPLASAFLASLNDEKVLGWAEFCRDVYKLTGTNGDMTRALVQYGHINIGDHVVMQGFRNGGQLSSVVVHAHNSEVNLFRTFFVGTASILDGITDIDAIPVNEHVHHAHQCLSEAHITVLHVTSQNDQADKHVHVGIDIHQGFKRAGKDMLTRLFEELRPYVDFSRPLVFEISGHSLGGGLASHMAYHIKKRLARTYEISPEQVSIKLLTFAAAGCFLECDLPIVSKILDAPRTCVHFYRHNDLARELTDIAGFKNPGNWVFIDNFAQMDGSMEEYLERVEHLKESPHDIANRVKGELANHSMVNYVETIKQAIIAKRELIEEGATQVIEIDPSPSGIALSLLWLDSLREYIFAPLGYIGVLLQMLFNRQS